MLCSQLQLVKHGDGFRDVKPLPCRSWGCDHCAPRRRAQLMAQIAAGEPNRCLTLTCSVGVGATPADRYGRLHEAWRSLTKRLVRQFALSPEKRWLMVDGDGAQYQNPENYKRTAGVRAKEYTRLNYFAFVEATKRGEPHLHILLRSPYIPQDWLSYQMAELLHSPIVWIDIIRNTKSAIAYVSKYVTKAPAQFGKTRRYWSSRKWEVKPRELAEYDRSRYVGSRVELRRWSETIEDIDFRGLIPLPTGDGWLRLHTLASWRREFGDPGDPRSQAPAFRAAVALGRLRASGAVDAG